MTQEIEVLKEKEFNKEEAEQKIKSSFEQLEKDIKEINTLAENKGIYLRVEETREKEKLIKQLFPFMHNETGNLSVYRVDETLKIVEHEFYRRFQTALYSVGFVRLNEKTKVVTCKKKYFLGNLSLYPLVYVAAFENNLSDDNNIEIIKEYQNLNVDFKFKNENDYNVFKEIVYYSNDVTEFIINNAPEDVIKAYKDAKKEKYANETYILYEWVKDNMKDFSYKKPINTLLVNKAWGC